MVKTWTLRPGPVQSAAEKVTPHDEEAELNVFKLNSFNQNLKTNLKSRQQTFLHSVTSILHFETFR